MKANKALHRTFDSGARLATPSLAPPSNAGELGRSLRRDEKLVNNDLRSEYDNT